MKRRCEYRGSAPCQEAPRYRVFIGDSHHGGGALSGGWCLCEAHLPLLVEKESADLPARWTISVRALKQDGRTGDPIATIRPKAP